MNAKLGDFGLAKLCDHGGDPQTSRHGSIEAHALIQRDLDVDHRYSTLQVKLSVSDSIYTKCNLFFMVALPLSDIITKLMYSRKGVRTFVGILSECIVCLVFVVTGVGNAFPINPMYLNGQVTLIFARGLVITATQVIQGNRYSSD
ncbi:hypothetical protein IFM89_029259 [Coptis chinensis]|uniref:Uncharacterized protein n=1 Tax=Coptis chinensis TaxID=261450 RepID=A0A835GZR6_9MAGN|nr:hypothetical protein IFM89_029259 [Coptis chinensis]